MIKVVGIMVMAAAWSIARPAAAADDASAAAIAREIAGLPVFGRIEWTRSEIPFIAPGPRGGISGTAMAAHDGKVYLAGGFIPAGDETQDEDRRTSRWMHVYDPATERWTRLADLPARREYVNVIVTDDAFFAVGGGKQKPFVSHGDVFRYDFASAVWTSLSPLAVGRTHMATGRVGGKLIVVGGNYYDTAERGYGPTTARATTEVYDLGAGGAWKQGASLPGAGRGWSAAVAAQGRFYIFGGVTFLQSYPRIGQKFAETWSYDPAADGWEARAPSPVAVSGWKAALYKDRYAILVGGFAVPPGSRSHRGNDQPMVYDTLEDRWLRFDDSATPGGGVYNDPGVAIIGDKVYVVGAEGVGAHYNTLLVGRIEPGEKR